MQFILSIVIILMQSYVNTCTALGNELAYTEGRKILCVLLVFALNRAIWAELPAVICRGWHWACEVEWTYTDGWLRVIWVLFSAMHYSVTTSVPWAIEYVPQISANCTLCDFRMHLTRFQGYTLHTWRHCMARHCVLAEDNSIRQWLLVLSYQDPLD